MTSDPSKGELRDLNRETQSIWDENAAFWDEKMGEGSQFQRLLVGPATERLLSLRPGESVLEVACGNGVFARRLAELGAQVLACDFSARLLELARARASRHSERIEYRLVDATDEGQLLALGERRFDAAVCNMALMDMAAIDPLLRALARLLKPGGRFVFTLLHPCFNHSASRLTVEEEDRDGELVNTYAVKVVRYLNIPPTKGLAIVGQPRPHYYFHRPLSALFNACFAAGFALDGIEEPGFDAEAQSERPLSWANFREIPPVLAARMRLMER